MSRIRRRNARSNPFAFSPRRRRTRTKRARSTALNLDAKAVAYRQLLLDPCNGPLTSPVGLGPTTGLLVRQKYLVNLTDFLSANSLAQANSFFAILRPALGSLTYGLNYAGSSPTFSTATRVVDLETGILTSARAYRAVAACMKFVPTGALGTRSGTVSYGYIPDDIQDNTDTSPATRATYIDGLRTVAQRVLGNAGSMEIPEVRWIPSGPEDLEFRQKSVTYNADSGGAFMAGFSIDAPAKTVSSTDLQINGYLDITVVWEWVPAYTSGVVSTVQPSSRNTLNDVLATFGDIARTLTDHAYASALAGAKRMARDAAMAYIGGSVMNAMSGPPLLTA